MNKLERLKITSKITNRKIKRMKVIHIHLFLPFIHDGHVLRRERKSEGWDELSNPRERRPKKMAEGKKFLRLPGLSCKATAKKMTNM